jgi:hypothetical protein
VTQTEISHDHQSEVKRRNREGLEVWGLFFESRSDTDLGVFLCPTRHMRREQVRELRAAGEEKDNGRAICPYVCGMAKYRFWGLVLTCRLQNSPTLVSKSEGSQATASAK